MSLKKGKNEIIFFADMSVVPLLSRDPGKGS